MAERERVAICHGHGRFLCSVGYGHLCIDAAVDPEPDPCLACGGLGQYHHHGELVTCAVCKGYGRVVEGVPG